MSAVMDAIRDASIDPRWIAAAVAFASAMLAGGVFRVLILRKLGSLAERTSTALDDLAIDLARRYVLVFSLLGGLAASARVSPIPEHAAELALRVIAAGFVVVLSAAASRACVELLGRSARLEDASIATTSLAQNVARVGIVAMGGLLALSNLGVTITPLLTALGVGSLAVALALQPTLSNLFAGLHIALARPLRVGDFVEIEGGAKGFVADIGWRATRIRELPNNMIIVPNGRIAEMVVTNYAYPETEQSAVVQVGVAYGSDLEQVERVTCDVAREVLVEVEGGVPSFDPFIRFHTFGESSIDFSVILRIRDFTSRYLVTHEFIKRLKARFDAEKIEIPFPQRVVHRPAGAHTPEFASAVADERGRA